MKRRRITDVFLIDSSRLVWSEALEMLLLIFPGLPTDSIHRVFHSVNDLYHGNFPGYRACNTGYHDLGHANATFLAMARLIHGAMCEGRAFSESDVVAALTAAMLHDVGYIQNENDRQGTGAKYKETHERRSMDFLSRHGKNLGLSPAEINAGRRIISCTEMNKDIASIAFPSFQIEVLGKMLASADLLAQLSHQTYLENLLFLYYECREAGVGNYKNESDMIKKALPFYDIFEDRLNSLMNEADRFMELHFASYASISENLYRRAINGHKKYLVKILSSDGADPCQHLRRGGIVELVHRQYADRE